MKTMYRIHWRALKTGATGHGTATFPREEAQYYADQLNAEYAGLLVYWIVAEVEQEAA